MVYLVTAGRSCASTSPSSDSHFASTSCRRLRDAIVCHVPCNSTDYNARELPGAMAIQVRTLTSTAAPLVLCGVWVPPATEFCQRHGMLAPHRGTPLHPPCVDALAGPLEDALALHSSDRLPSWRGRRTPSLHASLKRRSKLLPVPAIVGRAATGLALPC